MLVTIQAPSPGLAARGKFEAMKFGVLCEPMADNTLELSVADIQKARIICDRIDGRITSILHGRKDESVV